jgi:hypothetical protein
MAHPLGGYCLVFPAYAEVEAMAHPLGCYCLDFDPHPEPEAMAHPLGCYCLDFPVHAEVEANDVRPDELEATAHLCRRHCLEFVETAKRQCDRAGRPPPGLRAVRAPGSPARPRITHPHRS